MKPDFGEQTMEDHSRRLASDNLWLMRWIWFQRTGKPPIEFEEFVPHEIVPFLTGIEKVIENPKAKLSKRLKASEGWNEPILTGDPLIDKWERELAEGLSPNLKEGLK